MNTTMDKDKVIELDNVSKSFGDAKALRNLSLKIPAGQVVGFLGPNGAGKTTTIKMLMGLMRRDSGSISVLGSDPGSSAIDVKLAVGYVPEQHYMHRWMRVDEVIAFCQAFYPTWNHKYCAELVKSLRLDTHKRIKQLSKGMLVKVSLVLALAHQPELLILDEPMAGLDPLIRDEILEGVLQTLSHQDQTVLFSSHTLGDVQRVADSIAIIDEGELLIHCSTDELLNSTKRIRAVLVEGTTPIEELSGTLWQRVHQREWLMTVRHFSEDQIELLRGRNQVEHIEVIDLSLEDIFKDYIRGRRSASCI